MKQLAIYTLLLFAMLLFIACSTRKTDKKISKKVTESDVRTLNESTLKLIDTSKKQVQKLKLSQGSVYQELTVYSRPGTTLTIGRDGSISGQVDSAKSRKYGQRSSTLEVNRTETTGKTVDSGGKAEYKVKMKQSTADKDKTTERTGMSLDIAIAISIIVLVAIFFGVKRYEHKKWADELRNS